MTPGDGHGGGALLVALRVVDPERLTAASVHRDSLGQRRIKVEDATNHQRGGLEGRVIRGVLGAVKVVGLVLQFLYDVIDR